MSTKKLGTYKGQPASLVLIEEFYGKRKGIFQYECVCGEKFFTMCFALSHCAKKHGAGKIEEFIKPTMSSTCKQDFLEVYDDCTSNILLQFDRQMQERLQAEAVKYQQEIRRLEENILESEKQQPKIKTEAPVRSSENKSEISTSSGFHSDADHSSTFSEPHCSLEITSVSSTNYEPSCNMLVKSDRIMLDIEYSLSDPSESVPKPDLSDDQPELETIISLEEYRERQRLHKFKNWSLDNSSNHVVPAIPVYYSVEQQRLWTPELLGQQRLDSSISIPADVFPPDVKPMSSMELCETMSTSGCFSNGDIASTSKEPISDSFGNTTLPLGCLSRHIEFIPTSSQSLSNLNCPKSPQLSIVNRKRRTRIDSETFEPSTTERAAKRIPLEEEKQNTLLELRKIVDKIAKEREILSNRTSMLEVEVKSEILDGFEEPNLDDSADFERSENLIESNVTENHTRKVDWLVRSEEDWERKRRQDLKEPRESSKLEKYQKYSRRNDMNIARDYRERKSFVDYKSYILSRRTEYRTGCSSRRGRIYSMERNRSSYSQKYYGRKEHHRRDERKSWTDSNHKRPKREIDDSNRESYRNNSSEDYRQPRGNVDSMSIASDPQLFPSHPGSVTAEFISEVLESIPLPSVENDFEQYWFAEADTVTPLSVLLAGPAPPPPALSTDLCD